MHRFLVPLSIASVLLAPISTHAQTRTWIDTGTGNWNQSGNWSGSSVPTSSNSVIIRNNGTSIISSGQANSGTLIIGKGSGSNDGTLNILSSGTLTALRVILSDDNGAKGDLNLSGLLITSQINESVGNDGRLTFSGGTLRATTSGTLIYNFEDGDVTLASQGGTIDSNGYDVTVTSPIDGSGSLTKRGNGVLTLSGENVFSGGLRINQGVIAASSDDNLGYNGSGPDGTLTFNSGTLRATSSFTIDRSTTLESGGGTIEVNSSRTLTHEGNFSGTGSLTKIGAGTLVLSGTNSFRGGLNLNAGVVSASSDNNLGYNGSGPDGTLTFNSGTLRATNSFTIDRATTLNATGGTFEVNSSRSLEHENVISGTGSLTKTGAGTLVLSGTNTYRGGTVIQEGAVAVSRDANLGHASGEVTLNEGTLRATSSFTTQRQTRLLSGGGRFDVDSSRTLTHAGVISGVGALSKLGSGTLVLTGSNTYEGPTNLLEGVTSISQDANLGTASSAVYFDGGILRTTATFSSIREFVLTSSNSTIDVVSGTFSQAGKIVGTGYSTRALTKTGSGVLALSGTNLHTETNINGGVVEVTRNDNLGKYTGNQGDLNLNGGVLRVVGSGFTMNRDGSIGSSNGGYDIVSGTLTQQGNIGGNGALVKTGTGTLVLSGTNTYDKTVLKGGVVSVNSNRNLGDYTGTEGELEFDGGTLRTTSSFTMDRDTEIKSAGGTFEVASGTLTQDGDVDGSGALVKSGTGTLVLTNNSNNYAGGTVINGGVVAVSGDSRLGASWGGLTFNGGTLRTSFSGSMNRATTLEEGGGTFHVASGVLTQRGVISGTGSLTKTGNTLILTGTNTYTGATTIASGTLQVGNGGSSGQLGTGAVTNNGVLAFNRSGTNVVAGVISGSGSVRQVGSGTTILAETNTYTGGTFIGSGAIQLGNGGTTGGIFGDVTNNGLLIFNRADAVTYAGIISGSGGLVHAGTGTTTLTGLNTYTGQTLVKKGSLIVNGGLGNTDVTIETGAYLGGSGRIAGILVIDDDGMLAPGESPETLTVGELVLNNGSQINFELGTPGIVGGGVNDLVEVIADLDGSGSTGNLTLNGILNIQPLTDFGTGQYTLFTYGGDLIDNGVIFGLAPAGYNFDIVTSTNGLILLDVNYNGLAFWNGSVTNPNGVVNGGNGTWNLDGSNTNWTNVDGTAQNFWSQGLTAVFAGSAGTVNVDDAIEVAGLQFDTDGYVLNGTGSIDMGANGGVLVDDGVSATISTRITGTNVTKTGAGTAIFAGANDYTGITQVATGTLIAANNSALGGTAAGTQVASGAALGLQGGINIGAEELTLSGTGSGAGALINISGINTVAGAITLAGDTKIGVTAGRLNIQGGITSGTDNRNLIIDVAASGTARVNGAPIYLGASIGDNALAKQGEGVLQLRTDNTYTGYTYVQQGVVNIRTENALGADGGLGTVVSNGATLEVESAGPITVDETLVLNGAGSTGSNGALRNVAGNNTWAGDIYLATDSRIEAANGTQLTLDGTITAYTGTQSLRISGAGDTVVSGTLALGSGGLIKGGSGTVTLNEGFFSNQYTGTTSVLNGTLTASQDFAFSISSRHFVDTGATLDIGSTAQFIGSLVGTGLVQLAPGGILGVGTDNTNFTFSGTIAGPGAQLGKSGTGVFRLNAATDVASVSVGNGTVRLMADNLLSSTTNIFINNPAQGDGVAEFDVNGFEQTINNLVITAPNSQVGASSSLVDIGQGRLTVTGTLFFEDSGSNAGNNFSALIRRGRLDFAGGVRDIYVEGNNNSTDLEISARIVNGGINYFGLANSVVSGNYGTLMLSGNNTYAGGTVINSGVLQTLDVNALGTGSLVLKGGAGALFDPIGEINIGSDFNWEGGLVGVDLGLDLINVAGALNNSGGGLRSFVLQGDADVNTAYTIATYATTNFVESDFRLVSNNPNVQIQHVFEVTGANNGEVRLTLLSATATGAILQNSSPVDVPTFADFFVNGPVTTGSPLEDNTINSLTFAAGSSLKIFNELEVTSGLFTVANGVATINGDLVSTPGAFNKNGAGTLVINSDAYVEGPANINSGALYVNGGFETTGGLTVFQNALLGGDGLIIGDVVNNGIVAPGNSPGVLSIAGNYTQTSTGVLQIEIANPSLYDQLIVDGNAALGGVLDVLTSGNLSYGQQYYVIVAESITGDFDEIVMSNPSRFRGRFVAEDGVGTLVIAPTSYKLVAETQNQKNVAGALDSFITASGDDREVVSTALDFLTASEYPAAFDQIAPSFYESLADISIEQVNAQNQMLAQRLSAVRLGARGFNAVGIQAPIVNDKDGKSVMDAKDGKDILAPAPDNNWGVWVQGNGIFAKITNANQVPNYRTQSGGFIGGVDYRWSDNFATGLYAGYQGTYAKYNNGGNTTINSAVFGGYATYQNGGFYSNAIIGGGYSAYSVRRPIEFSSVDRTARSRPDGGQFTTYLDLGYDWQVGKFTFGPILGGQYTYAGIAPFTEDGADSLDLKVGQQNANSIRTSIGGRIAYTWNVTENIAIIPEVRMFWQHEFLENPRTISASLDGGNGPGFDYTTSAPDRDAVFAGAGVSGQFGKDWNAFFYYNADFGRQDYIGHMISGGLNWQF